MIAQPLESLRLFLHILGATVWVGGQLTLAALVPLLRNHDLGAQGARAYNRIAWPAYVLLVITGTWNVIEEGASSDQTWWIALTLKVILVSISGFAAFAHTRARGRASIAIWGALSGLSALAALYVGVLLAG